MAKLLDFIFSRQKERYGGYELLEEIAKGGMSRIWKARQPQTGRVCALKILTPESVELMDRFRRLFEADEGAIALRLNHPNVVKTFDYGRGSGNDYYIAMEYVSGPNLEVLIAVQDKRVRDRRFDLIMQIGSGLRYIHRQGLIHRDFCPKNVLRQEDGTPKIIDFGLTIPAEVKARTVATRAGTASYMAPEQVRGLPLDERTDIYAFGVSAFEVLTGRRPFPVTADRTRRMWEHLNVEPLPLREVEPEMPEEMEKVIQKCIAKNQHMRYKSMDKVMKDMRAAVEIALSSRVQATTQGSPPVRARSVSQSAPDESQSSPGRSPMNPRLRVEVGRQVNFEYEVPPREEEEAVWLGRGEFCKIKITDAQLSRRHCQFSFEDGRLYVADMGSRNGTRVNGQLIQGKRELKHEDRVTVGSHELVVVFPPPSAAAKAGLAELGTQEQEREAYETVAKLTGQDFGGYLLEEIIFNGKTSVVFRARDQQRQELVAVKILKPLSRVTVEDQNRFIRGAKHGAILRHPNFVRIYKGGRFEGWFFVAMEFVPGRNLQEVVDKRGEPLDLKTALKIEGQLLDALEHAYQQDIVLRAVRPDNILVTRDMVVKLTDFDLVKPLSGRQDAQVTRVMDGSLSVDPSFAAPELIAYPVVADQKADIFGAGAVLFFMLCARAPFGSMLPANKLSSAFDRVVEDPHSINPAVPEAVSKVILQSMSEYERYGTPLEMKQALERAAAEEKA